MVQKDYWGQTGDYQEYGSPADSQEQDQTYHIL